MTGFFVAKLISKLSRKPNVHAVNDANGKEYRASDKKAPRCRRKAKKQVRKPCRKAKNKSGNSEKIIHFKNS